jgi:hypothetical protein
MIQSGKAGFAAAVVHHLSVQYPRQANIFMTLYAYFAEQLVFGGLHLWFTQADDVKTFIQAMPSFNTTLVSPCVL